MFWFVVEVGQASGKKVLFNVKGILGVGVLHEMTKRIARRQGARAQLC